MNLFSKKEQSLLWVFVFAGILGALFFALNYKTVSPTTSLNFQVSRAQAKEAGERFLKKLKLDLAPFRCAVTFQSDDDEAVYVEKTLGFAAANDFFQEELAPWYWKLRWFRPLLPEEIAVAISPNGKIVGYLHQIEEEGGGGFLSRDEAFQVVISFLEKDVGIPVRDWKLVSSEQDDKKFRRDHQFIWEKKGVAVGKAPIQMACGIHGTEVGSFSLYVQIPESFTASAEQTEANRGLLTRIFTLLYIALGIFVGGEFLLSLKQHNFRWRIPLLLAAGIFALSLLSDLNSLPLELAGLDTRETFSHFILSQILSSAIKAFWSALFILMVAVGADNLQRAAWPEKERLVHIFSRDYFLSKNYIRSVVVGYALGALQLGYVAAFYLATRRLLGGWSPLESPYYNVASSTLPWIFPLTIGITAALNEELFFRMFSISLLKRLLRWILPALLIPAIVWGFLHSNYYVEPIYIRGVELAFVGFILGFIYLKFGIMPTILCHYTYNSVLGFIPLLRSESLFFKTSGWISLFWIVLPALIAVVAFVRLKIRGLAGDFLIPAEEAPSPLPRRESTIFRWGKRLGYEFFGLPPSWKAAVRATFPMEKSLLKKGNFFLIVGLCLALLALGFYFLPSRYGPKPEGKIGEAEAIQIAREFLNDQGVENLFQRQIAVFYRETYSTVGTYLVRTVGLEKSNQIAAEEGFSFLRWGVVFYKLGDPNRLTVSLDADGRVVGFQASRGEETKVGGTLSEAEARAKAEAMLRRFRPRDAALFQYAGGKTSRLKARADHAFIWEKKIAASPELLFRILIQIHGKEIGGYEESLSPPEHFIRGLKEKRGLDTLVMALVALIVLVGSVAVALDAVFKFRQGAYSWGLALKIGILFLICDVIEKTNAYPDILLSLVEDNPLNPSVFLVEKIINLVLGQLTSFGFMVFFTAFALAIIQEQFGAFSFASVLSPRQWGQKGNLQGVCLALLGFLVLWFGSSYLFTLELHFVPGTVKASYPILKETPVNSWIPVLGMAARAVKDSLLFSLTLGALIAFLKKVFRQPLYLALFVALTSSLQYVSSQFGWTEMGIKVALHLAVLAILFLLLTRLIRFNLIFFLIFFWIRSLFPHLNLLHFSDSFLYMQGLLALVLILLPFPFILLSQFQIDRRGRGV